MLVCKGQDARQKKNPRPCTPSSAQDLNGRRSHQHLLLARPRRVVLLEHPALATERPQNEVIAGFRALCEMGEKLNRSPAVHIWHPVGTRESEPSRAVDRIARNGSPEDDAGLPLQAGAAVERAPVVADQELPLLNTGVTLEFLAVHQLVPLVECFVPVPEGLARRRRAREGDGALAHDPVERDLAGGLAHA